MRTFQRLVVGGLVLSVLWSGAWWQARSSAPRVVQWAVLDPYDDPLLSDYKTYRDALLAGDEARLSDLVTASDSYLAYRTALLLAGSADLAPAERAHYYRRVLELRIDDPLDKLDRRKLLLEYARVAEAGGLPGEALSAFEAALPAPEAVRALHRLQSNPYRLSNSFLKARLYQEALDALGERAAPSIEAPALRALRNYEGALGAYRRWLAEQPTDVDARYGEAWCLYYLGELEQADALFSALPGTSALRGRSLIAWGRGELERAVALLRESGEADHLWAATGYLEARDRYEDTLTIYLELARGDSSYADDAAYRAAVLAARLGLANLVSEAEALLPANSFFALKAGLPLSIDAATSLASVRPGVVELSGALARVGDLEAAVGELLFALREAVDVPTRVAIAEQLQLLGEYRHSQRAGADLLGAGVSDRRVWELAYPQAYPGEVGAEAVRNGLEPQLIWAIMRQESAFFPRALSSSNAQGLMQVIPSTWDWLAELQKEAPGDPFDIATNIRYGSFYLRWLLNYLGDDRELVIASYNRGQGYIKRLFEGSVVQGDKDELYREIDALETREYLQRVSVNYAVYKALYPSLSLRP